MTADFSREIISSRPAGNIFGFCGQRKRFDSEIFLFGLYDFEPVLINIVEQQRRRKRLRLGQNLHPEIVAAFEDINSVAVRFSAESI